MKKLLSVLLAALMIFAIVGAFSACSKDANVEATDDSTAEAVTSDTTTTVPGAEIVTNEYGEEVIVEPTITIVTVKLNNKNIFVTYDDLKFTFDVEQNGVVEREGKMTFYGDGFDESTAKDKLAAFNAIEDDSKNSEVKYGEKKLGDYTAKTVIYNGGNNYYKTYFITLDDPIDGMYAVELDGCLGASLDNEAAIDAIAETLTLGEKPEAEVEE